MRQIFFGKSCTNTKTHSFAIYAIRVFDERNNHFFPGTTLISTSTLQILISPCHKYWLRDLGES